MDVQNSHRPFFLAGIATVLTLGCVWGAINLFTIGAKESFSAINYSWLAAVALLVIAVATPFQY
ncbi:MAG TPA: hypothetical protein VFP64_20070 [Pyrinomonadaceae bacterium]|nr:hypothetical protein [Pyrinomonadaceae bacterium]